MSLFTSKHLTDITGSSNTSIYRRYKDKSVKVNGVLHFLIEDDEANELIKEYFLKKEQLLFNNQPQSLTPAPVIQQDTTLMQMLLNQLAEKDKSIERQLAEKDKKTENLLLEKDKIIEKLLEENRKIVGMVTNRLMLDQKNESSDYLSIKK